MDGALQRITMNWNTWSRASAVGVVSEVVGVDEAVVVLITLHLDIYISSIPFSD